jgi:hypothetical protein
VKSFHNLKWTPEQIRVYNLLKEGSNTKSTIASMVGVSNGIVTKVSKAMEKGLAPPFVEDKSEESEDGKGAGSKTTKPKSTQVVVSGAKGSLDPSLATFLKLLPTAVNCQLTPLMSIARQVAIVELGWPPSMSWEDFFDTCLYHVFKHWGYTLQAYAVDKDEDKQDSPVTAPEKEGGNGHVDIKQLSLEVAQCLMEMSKQQEVKQ